MAGRGQPPANVGAGATGNAGAPGAERKVFLNNGLALSVQSGDITKMPGDVVVVGEDTDFSGRGAVAKALINKGGVEYERNREFLKGRVQSEGFKHVLYRCPAGSCFYFREVFHAMTIIIGRHIPDWGKHLENLFYHVGLEAETSQFQNVVTPLLGAGMASGTVDASLQALVNGLSRFAPQHLQEVIIVEYQSNKAAEIRRKLEKIVSQNQQRRQGQMQGSGRGAGGEYSGNPNRPAQGTSASGQALLDLTQALVTGSIGDPTVQGAWGMGRGHIGQGGGSGGVGAGQPPPHQRTPTSSAQQQSGNPQNDLSNNVQPTVDNLIDGISQLAISRHKDSTNQKDVSNVSTAQGTPTPSGGTNQVDRQSTPRQSGRGRGILAPPDYKEGSPVDRPTGRDSRSAQNPDPLNKDFEYIDDSFGDREETQGPNQSNINRASGGHAQPQQGSRGRGILAPPNYKEGTSLGRSTGRDPWPAQNPGQFNEDLENMDKYYGDGAGTQGSNRPLGNRTSGSYRQSGQRGNSAGQSRGREHGNPDVRGGQGRGAGNDGSGATPGAARGSNEGRPGGEKGQKGRSGKGSGGRAEPKDSSAPGNGNRRGTEAGRDLHNRGGNGMPKKGDNPPAIVASPQVSAPPSLTRPTPLVANNHRQGRKDEETQSKTTALPWKSNEDPPVGYRGTRQEEEEEISNDYASPAKAPQMQGQNLKQADADLEDRAKNKEPENNPNLAGRNKDKGRREKVKKEKQVKEREPKRKGASDSKGPQHSSAGLDQEAAAQEPDMTGAAFTGTMPDGKMVVSQKPNLHLDGFPDCGTILIEYSFPNGTQGPQHPAPEQPYKGTFRRAYLPDNEEGQRVVGLLEKAFERKLTFHLERSGANGEWIVEFDDIPHKTSLRGGKPRRGYPDPDYLKEVLEALAFYGLRDTIPQEPDTDEEDQREEEFSSSAEARSRDEGEGRDEDVDTRPEQTEPTPQRSDAGGRGVGDVSPLEGQDAGEKPIKKSRAEEDQMGTAHSTLPEGDTTTEHGREEGVQEDVHSKMSTNTETMTATANTTMTSSNLEDIPPSSPSSSPVDPKKEARKQKRLKKNAALHNLQSSKIQAGRPQANQSAPEKPSTKKNDDPESKGTANASGEAEAHGETPAEFTATPGTKARPDEPAIPERGGNTSGQGKKQTHVATQTEPSSASPPDESQEESTKPETENSANGEKNSENLTKPRTARTVNEKPDAPTDPESKHKKGGQKNGESNIEPGITNSSAESQEQSTSPGNKDATIDQDRDVGIGYRTAHTPDETPEKTIKSESEVDTTGQKNEEKDVGPTTEPRAPSTPEEALVASTSSDDKVSTSGQRKSKTLSDSQPESRPASTPAGGRKEPRTDTRVMPVSDKDTEKSANPGGGVDSTGQYNSEKATDTPTEPTAPATPAENPKASTNAEIGESTDVQKKEKLNTPPELGTSETPAKGPDASAFPESEESLAGQRNEEMNTPPEHGAIEIPAKSSDASTTPEGEESLAGQRNEEMNTPPEPGSTKTPAESPDASTNPKSEESTDGRKNDELSTPPEPGATEIPAESPDVSAIPESEESTAGQRNEEMKTPQELRATETAAKRPDASANPESEDMNIPPESRTTETPAQSTDASAIPESKESTSERKEEEGDRGSPTEPRAAPSSEKTPEKSSNSEKVIGTDGQRKGETHTDSPRVSRSTPTPVGDSEAASSAKRKDGMGGQNKREMDTGTPTDSSSALTPVEDPARPDNLEKVTKEVSHPQLEEAVKPEGKDDETRAKVKDTEAEVKNQPEPEIEAERPGENGEKEKKSSSKKTVTDSKMFGNMPPGLMTSTTRKRVSVPGYDDCGVIVIEYCISKGEQKVGHPEPGSPYSGCVEFAFLPDNQEGRRVFQLLKKAFGRRLTFRLVQRGPDQEWEVEFADIPHKTCLRGGPERGGYPDPGYLEHVQSVLRDKYGIE